MPTFNGTIGVPQAFRGWSIINPLEEAKKIAPAAYHAPGTSPKEKATRLVQNVVREADRKREEELRYTEFLQKSREEADKIRELKKKKLAEYDAAIRKKKEEEEAAKELAKKQQKAEEDKAYAANMELTFGKPLADLIMYSPTAGINGLVNNISRAVYNFNNTFGHLVENAYSGHVEELVGKMFLNQNKQAAVDAHSQMLEYDRNIDAIKQQKLLLLDRMGAPVENQSLIFSDDYKAYRAKMEQDLAEYDRQINELEQKKKDPNLTQLDEEYKLDFIRDHGGMTEFLSGEILGAFQEIPAGTTKERELIKKARRKQLLSRYPAYLAKYAAENNLTAGYNPNGNNTVSRDAETKAISVYTKELNANRDNLKKKYVAGLEDLDRVLNYWNVAKAYKKGELLSQDASLFSWDYWKYVAPGMIGSSNSSWDQIKANAIQYGSMLAGAVMSFIPGAQAAAIPVMNIGQIASIPYQIKGGFSEDQIEIAQKGVDNIDTNAAAALNTALLTQIGLLGNGSQDAEVWEAVKEDLKKQSVAFYKKQGRSDAWIKDRYFSGTDEDNIHVLQDNMMGVNHCNLPEFQAAKINAGKGLNAQYQADNIRTTIETVPQVIMSMYPSKAVNKGGELFKRTLGKGADKFAQTSAGKSLSKIGAEAKEFVMNSKAGKAVKAAKSAFGKKAAGESVEDAGKYANGFRRTKNTMKARAKRAFEAGQSTSEALGFGYIGSGAIGAATAVGEEVLHYGSKFIPESMRSAARSLTDDLMMKYQGVYDKLFTKDWMRVAAKYGKTAATRMLMIGASEGAEEGVQYLNSNEDFASKYGWSSMSAGDLIINDVGQGGRVASAYLGMCGIGSSPLANDAEFWQNVKGGFALGGMGGFHPGSLINIYGGVKNAVDQYTTNQAISRSAVLNRDMDTKDRASNRVFAKLAMQNRETEVANRMQELYENDRRREEPELSQEDYDEKAKDAGAVMSMTKNKQVRSMLEAKGIKYGTDEYATAIADLYALQSQRSLNQNESKQTSNKLSQLYASNEFRQEVDNVVEKLKQDPGFGVALSRKKVEAGEKAVKDAIQRAKDAGVDTSTPEFAIELLETRKLAQLAVEDDVTNRAREVITRRSQLVNRLLALMKFKGQQVTLEDYFNLLKDKLNLKTFRPDAKTILNNTLGLIETVKKQLKELDPDIDFGKTDEDLLNALNSLSDVVTHNSDEILQYELNSAALTADAAVTNSYLNQFNYGLIKTKDGKYQYNPTQYKKEQDRAHRALKALLAGNKEEADAISQEDVTSEYNEAEVEGNEYKTRVGKIMLTNEQNMILNWMVADIYSGDFVNKYMEQLAEDELKRQNAASKSETETSETSKPSTDPVTGNPTETRQTNKSKWSKNRAARKAKIAKNREDYERRKAKAKSIYNRIKKSLHKNAYGSIIPALPQLAQATAFLMSKAATGAYKINEYVQDLREIASDIDIDAILPEIKSLYSKYAAKMAILGSDVINNLSTPQEIVEYVFQDLSSDVDIDTFTKVQRTLDEDANKIVNEISTYYHTIILTEDDVVVCNNTEAILHRNKSAIARANSIKSKLDKVIDSEEQFKSALTEIVGDNHPGFPIDTYVKYRSVDGITEAIADHIVAYTPSEGIINGIKARNAVLGVLLGEEYLLSGIEDFSGKDDFVNDVLHIKKQLDEAGYKVIKVGQTLFDENSKTSVQADVICIDNSGNVQVFDVLSSFADIRSRYDYVPGGNAPYTIRAREEAMLHQVEDVLHNKFGLNAGSLSVLPITCDRKHIHVLKFNDKTAWQTVKTRQQVEQETAEKIEKLQDVTKNQVNEINELVDQYNDLLSTNHVSHEKLVSSSWIDQPTVQQYIDYSDNLQTRKEEIVHLINDLQQEIQDKLDKNKDGVIEDIPFNDFEIPTPQLGKLEQLTDACRGLDAALSDAPDVTANTPEEKAAVDNLYRCIFDAQMALNDVLLDEELSQTDFSSEQELIASAMEKLAENPNYSNKQQFVQKWWCNNFVLNTAKSNKEFVVLSKSSQYTSFFNTIKSWVDVLQGHLMTDLENSSALQDWYDTLLNVYFSTLLDNAAKFIESNTFDDAVKTAFLDKISDGRAMLADFNSQFSMRPDKEYPEAPKDETERVNRLPQKYTDLYTESTAHSPAYDAMLYSDIYFHISQHDDFAKNATVFFEIAKRSKRVANKRLSYRYYDITAGDVIMTVRYKNPDGSYNFAELPLVLSNPQYRPSNDPEVVARIRKINNVNKKFAKIVKQALEIVKNNPNKKLSYVIGVHKGKILYGKPTEHKSVTDFVFGDKNNKLDLYTINLSKECNLGIAAFTVDEKRETIGYNVYGGSDLKTRIGGFDEVYKKQRLKINNGAIVYFYNNGDGDRIGIPIESEQIGFVDAEKLVNLMNQYMLGNKYQDGYDIYELLSQRLYMANPAKAKYGKNNVNNLVTLEGRGVVKIGNVVYDINSQRSTLILAISQMRNGTDAELLNENIFKSDNLVFNAAKLLFRNKGVNEVVLPNGIKLTRDDFMHQNADGSIGSTWLGYMMRNGLLYTTAVGKSYKQIYVDNFKIVNKQDDSIDDAKKTVTEERKQAEHRRRDSIDRFARMLDDLNGELRYTTQRMVDVETENNFANEMVKYLQKVLGTDESILSLNRSQYIYQVQDGYVLGYCTAKMIEVCASAPMSVAYHEAFHRVFELLVPSTTRDKIYEAYKAKHKDVKTDREVAEALADHFTMFMDKSEKRADYKGIKSLYKVYNNLAQYFGLAKVLGFRRAYSMMSVYKNMNRGKYANTEITKENEARFEKLFGEQLHYTVYDKSGKVGKFKYLRDSGDVQDMVKALGYWIAKSIPLDRFSAKEFNIKTAKEFVDTLPNGLVDMLCGNDLADSELDSTNLAFREVFYNKKKLIVAKNGNSAYVTVYPNLDVLLEKIKDYVQSSITRFTEESDNFSNDNLDEETEKAMSKNIDKYDKASFEDSKLDALPDNVKFFFSTVPYMLKTSDGILLDLTRNKFGQPTFMPLNEVYNTLVSDLYKCESIADLDKSLQIKSEQNALYKYVYDKFHVLYNRCYTKDENGNDIVDYDAESYCINILAALHSQKIDFIVATSKTQDGGKEVSVKSSSLDRDKYTLTKQWYNILTSGQVSVFKRGRDKNNNLVFTDKQSSKRGEDIFNKTASFIQTLIAGLTSENGSVEINNVVYNVYDSVDLNDLKNLFVDNLNRIGIIVSRDALDYMLSTEYVGDDTDTFRQLLTNKGINNAQSFIDKLSNIVTNANTVNEDALKQAYTRCGFVNLLASYTSKYRRNCIESMSFGLNGKKLHAVSLNNTISFITSQLNTRDKYNPTVRTLMKYGYNISQDGVFSQGSIILEHILNGKQLDIQAHTYIGSKSDNKNDGGSEYKEEPIADDYVAKMAMLLSGMLIFPTLADKGTWMCLTGVPIPGMQFNTISDENGNVTTTAKNVPTCVFKNGKAFIRPSNQVLDQMIAYANTERLAIQQCMEDLGYKEIPDYEKQGRHVLTDAEKIKNLHTPNKVGDIAVEPNGTRFLSLTEVAELDKDGKIKLDDSGNIVTVNLNDPTKSSVEMLKLANDKFFSLPLEKQRDIMAYTLNVQYQLEVLTAIDLGIVKRTEISKYNPDTKKPEKLFDATDESMFNLDSEYLNVEQIHAVANEILKTIPSWNNLPAGREKSAALQCCKSLAIASILSDATTRSIISSNEVTRCFTGNPAMFKVTYKGHSIKDSTFDVQKRIGGIVSTGDDNAKDVPGIPRTYTCAECKDYEVPSTSDVMPNLKQMFIDGSVRDVWATKKEARIKEKAAEKISAFDRESNKAVQEGNANEEDQAKAKREYKALVEAETQQLLDEVWEKAYASDSKAEDFLTDADLSSDADLKALNKAKENGEKFASAFDKDINVADGQAYITEQMCENLLRLRGALNGKVKKAFDLLKGDDKFSWQDKVDAYKLIYDAVNIVTTKYTAYGFRDHTLNGEDCSDVAVAYYNKYSLAPLFACVATGNMAKIYDKMKNEKVDMLLMTSAIKIGSQGAVKYDGNDIAQNFNKYEQDYSYLRRQLNTDPEEGDKMALGTQMVKIVLQSLRLHRNNYVDAITGENVSGQELLDRLMGAINRLTELGYESVKNEFGIDKYGHVDNKKLSNFLKSQLTSRNANKGLIEAVSLDENGNFKAPIAATSDSKFIESILKSFLDKRLIDIETPGNSFVQRSIFAMEGSSTKGGAIKSDKDMSPTINGGKRLQMINNDGSMDAVISIDYFKSILPEGLSFNAARQWLIDHKIIGNTEDVHANTIGYRIPTQALSSIHALRFVDVIPAVKCTIFLPEEFTKITGSDFDIDHLYLASLNYTTSEKLNEKELCQNEILNCMLTVLKDTKNAMHSLYKSIDNDTELLTSLAKQLPELKSTKNRAYNFGTLHEQVFRRSDYITGKFGIGPFALNVTNQTLTRIFGVKFKETEFTREVGLTDLGRLLDQDDNYIDSWISAFINAHVDIVKDPYISKMNVNKFTYNMVNLLIRAGFGKSAMWFITQPVIVEMANASNAANSQFMRTKGTSVYSNIQNALAEAVAKWVNPANITPEIMLNYLDWTQPGSREKAIDCVLFIKDHPDVLMKIAANSTTLKPSDVVYENMTVSDVQETMFFAWTALEKYATALGNLVQRSKIDTKKQGKSLLAIRNYYNNYNNMFNPQNENSSLFDMDSLHKFDRQSWVARKTELACTLPFVILNNQTFEGNTNYINSITNIYQTLNPGVNGLNVPALETISKAFKTQIKSAYITRYAKEFLNKTDQDITNLFIGNRCMAYRLNMLHHAIGTNEKYKRLANNPLIKSLYTLEDSQDVYINGTKCKKPCFISIADTVADSSSNSDMFIDGWEDLLNDGDPFVRSFARDLIIYSYMTSGEDTGWNNLFKYVPPAWVRGEIDNYESFAQFVSNRLNNADADDYLNLDEIVANNYRDPIFCTRLFEKDKEGNRNILYNSGDGLMAVAPVAAATTAPLYIVYKTNKSNELFAHDVYKCIAYIPLGADKKIPVYSRIKTRGYSGHKKQKVLEYGWNFNYAENIKAETSNYDEFADKLDKYIFNNQSNIDPSDISKFIEAVNNTTVTTTTTTPVAVRVKEKTLNYDKMSDLTMNSGGAHGADSAWDFYARKNGVTNIRHFRGSDNRILSKPLAKRGITATVLSDDQLQYAREEIYRLLGAKYDNTVSGNLLARNYYQVSTSDAVFAVATLKDDRKSVTGGTNTAVLLGIVLKKPVHVFDINTERWYSYDRKTGTFAQEDTPILTKNFAGVGTRDIENYQVLKDGKWVGRTQYVGDAKAKVALDAIQSVFDNTTSQLNEQPSTNQVDLRSPKNYTAALAEIEKSFDIDNNTTKIVGKDAASHAILKLNIDVSGTLYAFDGKDVLNMLYKTSKFLNKNTDTIGTVTMSESIFYGDFSKKLKRLTGETVHDALNEDVFGVHEDKSSDTFTVPQRLMNTLSFLESLKYDQRKMLMDYICHNGVYDLIGDEKIDVSDEVHVTDIVEDNRLLDLFKELGVSENDMKKAEEVKNHCKGGK